MNEIINKTIIESRTSNRKYVVSQYSDGSYACSCPSWIFNKGHKTECKHILEVKHNIIEQTLTIDGLKENGENAESDAVIQNQEGDICAMCKDGIGEVPISDEKGSYWICEKCDSDMFDNSMESKGLEKGLENEIDEQKEARADLMIKYGEVKLER